MLGTRLTIGLAMVAAFVAMLALDELFAPWYPLWFVAAVVILGAAAIEVVNLLNATSARPSGNTVFGGVLAVVVANWIPHLTRHLSVASHLDSRTNLDPSLMLIDTLAPLHALAWPLWVFAAVVMFTFIAQSVQFDRPGATMATIAGTVLAVAYVGLLGSFTLQMRWLDFGALPVAMLVATAKGSDIGAYTLGRLTGRHKLWPRLSPNKTIEGALGGLLFGALAALAVTAIARLGLAVPSLGWAEAIGFGLLVSTAAQLGDLMESMIKRDCARKDASAAVPGFGGVLDVVDSLLFAGPVAFGYWLWLGPYAVSA